MNIFYFCDFNEMNFGDKIFKKIYFIKLFY